MPVLSQAIRSFVSRNCDILVPPLTMNSLKPLDVEVMKRLGSRVNLIPVIAKADTMTPEDLDKFKAMVSLSL